MVSTISKQKLYPTRIDLAEEVRIKVIDLLNQSLAATLDLKTHDSQSKTYF